MVKATLFMVVLRFLFAWVDLEHIDLQVLVEWPLVPLNIRLLRFYLALLLINIGRHDLDIVA